MEYTRQSGRHDVMVTLPRRQVVVNGCRHCWRRVIITILLMNLSGQVIARQSYFIYATVTFCAFTREESLLDYHIGDADATLIVYGRFVLQC